MNLTKELGGVRFLGGLMILFISLGLSYDTLTPLFENSDETLHYPYIKHIADGYGLPQAIPGQPWNQEGTQPPLYYLLVAGTTFWLDTDNLPQLLQQNPHWLFTEVRALLNDNQNRVLHGPMDGYHRAGLAAHIGRWWSLLFGLLTVAATYFLGRYFFPDNLSPVLTATGLAALTPQFIRVSSTVSNDSLAAALTAFTLLAALSMSDTINKRSPFRSQRLYFAHTPLAPALLGLLAGLALLAKLSALTALIMVVFIIFWQLFFLGQINPSAMLRWLGIALTVAALISGWWFLRNYRLYGEWLATETHLNLAGRNPLSLLEVWRLRAEIERAYWATFGWGQIRPPEWIFRLLAWLTRLGLLGVGLALLNRLIRGRPHGAGLEKIIILLVWAGLNMAIYLRWVMEVGSVSHTRLIFPAIPAISLLLALGWHTLLPRRLGRILSGLVIGGFLALNLYSLGWLIRPAFSPPPYGPPAAPPLELTYQTPPGQNSLKLSACRIYPQGQDPEAPKFEQAVHRGGVILVECWWEVLAPMDRNYSLAIVLLTPEGRGLARRETYPGLGLRPTAYLQPGQQFRDIYPLRLENIETSGPFLGRITINLFDLDSPERAGFPVLDAAGQEVTPVVDRIKVVPSDWPDYQPAHTVRVNFDDKIALVGYEQIDDRLFLYWESLAPVGADYTVFVHLLDESGEIIAQADAPPRYPTGWWTPGEIILDAHSLPVAADEIVAFRVGLYNKQRLPIVAADLPHQDGGVRLPNE